MKKGFTTIELMIVVSIIAIIAAIAIPNLLYSRIRANEASAVAAIKTYTAAQVQFQTSLMGRLSVNTKAGLRGYVDNFRNLYYGQPVSANSTGTNVIPDPTFNLALISQAFADAYIRSDPSTPGAAPTNTGGPSTPLTGSGPGLPYEGYYFIEAPEFEAAPSRFILEFALIAVPGNTSSTGNRAFWCNQQGIVHHRALPANVNGGIDYDSMGLITPSVGIVPDLWTAR